jgi:hypothetical protein
LLHALSLMITGCEKYPDDAEIQAFAKRVEAVHAELLQAQQDRLHHQAQLKTVNILLNTLVPKSSERYQELRAFLQSRFGLRSSTLGDFGVRPKARPVRRRKNAEPTAPET